jgi:hypothetical protein
VVEIKHRDQFLVSGMKMVANRGATDELKLLHEVKHLDT